MDAKMILVAIIATIAVIAILYFLFVCILMVDTYINHEDLDDSPINKNSED